MKSSSQELHKCTHWYTVECKGNPDIIYIQNTFSIWCRCRDNSLSHTHSPIMTQTHTHADGDSWSTHPLLRCWWLRNCHNPFCIDAATVQAERRHLVSGWMRRREGRPTKHCEKRGMWGRNECGKEPKRGKVRGMDHRDPLWSCIALFCAESCVYPLCNAMESSEWSERIERGFYTHTLRQREWQREGVEGEEGEKDALPSHDLLFFSTLTWFPGKPGKRRRRVECDLTNEELPFLYKGVKKMDWV